MIVHVRGRGRTLEPFDLTGRRAGWIALEFVMWGSELSCPRSAARQLAGWAQAS